MFRPFGVSRGVLTLSARLKYRERGDKTLSELSFNISAASSVQWPLLSTGNSAYYGIVFALWRIARDGYNNSVSTFGFNGYSKYNTTDFFCPEISVVNVVHCTVFSALTTLYQQQTTSNISNKCLWTERVKSSTHRLKTSKGKIIDMLTPLRKETPIIKTLCELESLIEYRHKVKFREFVIICFDLYFQKIFLAIFLLFFGEDIIQQILSKAEKTVSHYLDHMGIYLRYFSAQSHCQMKLLFIIFGPWIDSLFLFAFLSWFISETR